MGDGITVVCKNCGACDGFTLGIGMMYFPLDNVTHLLHHTKRKVVEDILQNHLVEDTKYAHELLQCPKCKRLYGRFWAKIRYDGDQVYETEYKCRSCRATLKVVDCDVIEGARCGECGELALTQDSPMCPWD